MTPREEGIEAARQSADDVLHRFGVREPSHIKPEAFASFMGVTVVDGQLDGARARLTRGKKPQIRISERTPSPAARKFSIAHELGHHVMNHFGDKPHAFCEEHVPGRVRSYKIRDAEAEAQAFAAGILMPRTLIATRCAEMEPSFESFQWIARDFATSLPASAIRYAEFSREACQVVLSTNGAVTWAFPNKTFKTRIARGRKLDERTDAYARGHGNAHPLHARTLPASAWIDTTDDTEIVEHSTIIPEGGVLSLLWLRSRLSI